MELGPPQPKKFRLILCGGFLEGICRSCITLAEKFEIFSVSENPWNELEIYANGGTNTGLYDSENLHRPFCETEGVLQNLIKEGLLTKNSDNVKG